MRHALLMLGLVAVVGQPVVSTGPIGVPSTGCGGGEIVISVSQPNHPTLALADGGWLTIDPTEAVLLAPDAGADAGVGIGDAYDVPQPHCEPCHVNPDYCTCM